MRMRGVVACVLVLLASCGHGHVSFPPVPPNLTPQQRVEAYNRLVGTEERTFVSRNYSSHSIVLANNLEVYYPEDLEPLVQPDSATARHIDASLRARHSRSMWKLAGYGLLLVGVVSWFATADSDTSGLKVVGPVITLSGIAALGVSIYYGFVNKSETTDAYHSFNDDLATRFGVCVQGLNVVPCEMLQQQQPPPPSGNGGYYGTTPAKQ